MRKNYRKMTLKRKSSGALDFIRKVKEIREKNKRVLSMLNDEVFKVR